MKPDEAVRASVLHLLRGGGAHVSADDGLKDFPEAMRSRKVDDASHSAWQLLEHMRIVQWDIVEFSRNSEHKSPEFPDGYWPPEEAPPSAEAWNSSVDRFSKDLIAMQKIVADPSTDLYSPIPHGDGQTILREAMLIADHNAYHLGQLVMLRRLLGAWHP